MHFWGPLDGEAHLALLSMKQGGVLLHALLGAP